MVTTMLEDYLLPICLILSSASVWFTGLYHWHLQSTRPNKTNLENGYQSYHFNQIMTSTGLSLLILSITSIILTLLSTPHITVDSNHWVTGSLLGFGLSLLSLLGLLIGKGRYYSDNTGIVAWSILGMDRPLRWSEIQSVRYSANMHSYALITANQTAYISIYIDQPTLFLEQLEKQLPKGTIDAGLYQELARRASKTPIPLFTYHTRRTAKIAATVFLFSICFLTPPSAAIMPIIALGLGFTLPWIRATFTNNTDNIKLIYQFAGAASIVIFGAILQKLYEMPDHSFSFFLFVIGIVQILGLAFFSGAFFVRTLKNVIKPTIKIEK